MALDYGTGGPISVSMAGPFGGAGGTAGKLTNITLPVANWKGGESPYYQVVDVEGVSVNSKVEFQPSAEIFYNKAIAMTAVNEEGVVTVYAIGDKPTDDYILQATITEVTA